MQKHPRRCMVTTPSLEVSICTYAHWTSLLFSTEDLTRPRSLVPPPRNERSRLVKLGAYQSIHVVRQSASTTPCCQILSELLLTSRTKRKGELIVHLGKGCSFA